MNHLRFAAQWLGAFGLWFVSIWFLRDWDLAFSRFFYQQDSWLFQNQPFWIWIYDYSPLPPVLLLLVSLILLIFPKLQRFLTFQNVQVSSHHILLYFLTGLLASGFVVNTILKGYCGKPRPYEVTDFGGQWNYQKTFHCSTAGKGASFPSGHVAATALLLHLCRFKFRHQNLVILLVSGYITMVALQRIGSGGHFLTDTLSAVFLVGWIHFAVEKWLLPLFSNNQYKWFSWGGIIFLLFISVITRPIYLEEQKEWQATSQNLQIISNLPLSQFQFSQNNQIVLKSTIQARGIEGVIKTKSEYLQCSKQLAKIFYHVDWGNLTKDEKSSFVLSLPKNIKWDSIYQKNWDFFCNK